MRQSNGFTLIEILVAIAIVGLLAAIALPSYQQATRKSNRSDARITMSRMAVMEERYFFQNNSYAGDFSDLVAGVAPGAALDSDEGHYIISLALTGGGTGWSMTATAVGSQAGDTECASLTQTSLGAKTSVDSDGNPSTGCW